MPKQTLNPLSAPNLELISSAAIKPELAKTSTGSRKSSPRRTAKKIGSVKIFVLDTNVLLHDPMALFQFQENTLVIPMVVLEELDKHKKGVSDLARNARQVTRYLDSLLQKGSLEEGFKLSDFEGSSATGLLFFKGVSNPLPGLNMDVADNQILTIAHNLHESGEQIILVSNDINLRVKAFALGITAQGYLTDRVLRDEDVLPTGFEHIDETYWAQVQYAKDGPHFWQEKGVWHARVAAKFEINTFLAESRTSDDPRLWRVIEVDRDKNESVLRMCQPGGRGKMLSARNLEQAMALELLYDTSLDLVSLLGVAGTGKTLMSVAAGLEQVRAGIYDGLLITRATVPMGEEIGFLPGTEQEKMSAWLGGTLRDAFSVLKIDEKDPMRQNVEIASMSFMRGRSFHRKLILIDEAQNLTIAQIKALLTRAAYGSKVILTGNLGQIDTPYLDQGNSGLTWAVSKTRQWRHSGHLILPRSERSRLASFIEQC